MNNIGGFGLKVSLRASVTFPSGITLTQFADDADSLDSASIKIRDAAMGLNGDIVHWGKAIAVPLVLNMIPESDDDKNLAAIAKTNRVGKGKVPTVDIINISVTYPDGAKTSFFNGIMTDAPQSPSVASAGRLKTKQYAFLFENVV